MFANSVSKGMVGKLQKVLMIAVALAVLFAALPMGKAQAADGGGQTYVKCNQRAIDVRDEVYGAYSGQWAAVRHHMWVKPMNSGWVYVGATTWQTIQVQPFSINSVGAWHQVGPIASGTLVSLATDITFWDNGTWGRVYSTYANHIAYMGAQGFSTSCMVF